ncbi:hydroxyacid dehydrogenase [Mycolicibacterium sp. P1-18]|uniref:2-hydroxyacid dehydrogenase n=1 Tax=Mycolicibacterium sp. P1-18 TaxID=2024615 RepID=UPI0011F20A80|nr:2-hydroxyacid dehydrogenase [Mycolicibacterium sp. P1-18]KAA0097546.1 hydroxyacid dehydrogenase [Mycolicibacterium sp. P1-18]
MKILLADANLAPHRERFEAALPSGVDVVWRPGQDPATLREELRDAEVYVGSRFTAAMADLTEKLRLIHVVGAGVDKVEFDALPPGVLVANTFHHERSIAEYVLSAAVMLRRDFLAQDRALRRGVWATSVYDDSIPQLPTLRDARIGFVGFGHIGQRAWEAFRGLGATGAAVTGSGRVDAAAHGLSWAGDISRLDALLTESDVVVLSAPLNPATAGMIGGRELQLIGPDGVLVNVGRGPLVDERALYEALRTGVLRAAAIDVWYRYPVPGGQSVPSALPFHELANVLMTPHSSGVTTDTFRGRSDDVAANVGRLARGEALANVVAR